MPYVKRLILNKPAQRLEDVLVAVQVVDNTRCVPNSLVLGFLDGILTEGNLTLCVKIITSIIENQVKYSRRIVRPAFDITLERSQEVKRNKDQPYARRLTSGYASRTIDQEDYPDSTLPSNIRDLVEMEVQRLLSKSKELTSEFREKSDYKTAIKHIKKENTNNVRT